MSDLVKHPRSGEPILRRVYADPGHHGWYYRDKKSDSVACYILEADVKAHNQSQAARIERLAEALRKLKNEVAGLAAFEAEYREIGGNSNWHCLMQRKEEATSLLAELEKEEGK